MDVVEFRRLTARVVATRNSESRAFLQAFDLAPGALSGWSERTCDKWRAWSRANDALRDAVAQLEDFSAQTSPRLAKRDTASRPPCRFGGARRSCRPCRSEAHSLEG